MSRHGSSYRSRSAALRRRNNAAAKASIASAEKPVRDGRGAAAIEQPSSSSSGLGMLVALPPAPLPLLDALHAPAPLDVLLVLLAELEPAPTLMEMSEHQ